jgi:PAS domain S-box-containing protein
MTAPIRLLICEDNDDDALLIATRLRHDGLDVTYERVERADAAEKAIRTHPPDVVISDYSMPLFTAEEALKLLHESGLDIPFILVSGMIGEERAAALMRVGAHDFVNKDHLSRLTLVIQRELREAQGRSQRRHAEAELRRSEQRFRRFAENAPDVIFRCLLSPQEMVEYVSPTATVILGQSPEELCGDIRRILSLVHPADRQNLEDSWRSPNQDPLVVRWLRADGEIVSTEQRVVGVRDEEGRLVGVEGILRDITGQLAAQRESERLQQQVRQSERLESLGQLAGGVAHDFNNLLAVIIGHAELALDDLPPGDQRRRDLESIQQAAERGVTLTRRLLIFSRLEPSLPEIVDLNAVVEDTWQLVRRTIGEDIEFVSKLDPELRHVMIDRSKLEQILLNIVVNSRTAMPYGGRLIVETTNLTSSADSQVRLSITDTGSGMPPDVVKRAFEPFFTTKGPGQGTGLGLSTAYGVVKDAGGDISIISQPGEGTTILVDLPGTDQVISAKTETSAAPSHGGSATILLVEDDGDVRRLITRILSRSGYEVIEAASPEEALSIETSVDLLLTDIVMAGMSGVELASNIQKDRPNTPVLLISGYTADSLPSGVALPPRTVLLRKPFTAATLLSHIHTILDT